MDIGEIAESTSNGHKMANALVTIILAGFLWVGKTTFEHVGQVAGLRHEIESSQQDRNMLRSQYDEIVSMLNEKTQSRFTREDGEKLLQQIKEVEAKQNALKDGFVRDYMDLKLDIASIATGPGSPSTAESPTALPSTAVRLPPVQQSSAIATRQIQKLEAEVASLRTTLVQIQRHVSLSRGSYPSSVPTPNTLVAQPDPSQMPAQRR